MTVINLHKRISDDLIDAFAAGGASGFRVAEMKKMASRLLGQGRYSLVLSVSYLLVSMRYGGIDEQPGGVERLLFQPSPQPGMLSDALVAASATSDRLKVKDNVLTLSLSKGESFEIDLGRTRLRGLLLGVIALAEFGGFERFRQAKTALAAAGASIERIRAAASAWSNDLDRTLQAEAGGRHMHAKVQTIRKFFAGRFGHERYVAGDVSSDAVLAFWSKHAVSGDWRRYATAHADVVTYLEQLIVQRSSDGARPLNDAIGIRVDYLGDDPDTHDPYLHALDGAAGSWGPFKNAKEGPNYLTEADHGRVARIGDLPAGLEALLKSSLRVMKFSSVENRLAHDPSAPGLRDALSRAQSYPQLMTSVTGALHHLELACWASIHALSGGGRPAALYLLQELAELDQFHRAFQSAPLDAGDITRAHEILLGHFCTSADPDCRALRTRASKAFDETNRNGFQKRDLVSPGGLDRLEAGWASALGALKHLRQRAAQLSGMIGEAGEKEDIQSFSDVYAMIYGFTLGEGPCA